MRKTIPAILLSLCLSLCAQAKGIFIDKLTTGMQEGMAIVTKENSCLGWTLKSNENGTYQTAYEIEMRSLYSDWKYSSKKVISSESQLISNLGNLYGKYAWRVRVWDETDTPSEWSPEAVFVYAPNGIWEAKWIGAITNKDAKLPEGRNFHGAELKKPEVVEAWEQMDTLATKSICLRKSFQTDKAITDAVVFISGLGNYELTINGVKVGDGEFTPLWSDFDKTVYFNTYDVTSLLKKGENVTGVLLGNGFYNVFGGGRYTKLKIAFGAPTLRMRLEIRYADGTKETILSDNSWKYALSPITFNTIYGGESYDARLEQKGWDKPGFNDASWNPAVIQEGPKGVLRPQMAPPVKIMERYNIQKVTKLTPEQVESATKTTKRTIDPSAFVLDMGQNLAGFPEITVRGKKGQKVTLLMAEALTDEGAINQRQTGRQHYYEYTLKGDGEETWHPRFSYYGFRYIQVEGAVLKGQKNPKNLPVLKNIQSCFIYNSAEKGSTFECSNPIFNAAHRLIEKAVRSNMQSVFTDCPHREKLGWLEQDHLNGPGLLYNYDLTTYIPKLMQDMADAQMPNGAMPTTAPQFVIFEGEFMDVFAESSEWGVALVVLPYMYYERYGDDSLIKKYYQNMRRYVDYLGTRADNHIVSFGLGDWYDYGDFRAGFSRNTPVPLVATAHYFMAINYLRKAARIVKNNYDDMYYYNLSSEVNRAFNFKYFDYKTAQFGTGSQCSNALPLFQDMVGWHLFSQDHDGGRYRSTRERVFKNLLKDIEAHGNRLTTGDVGNRYLIQTLAQFGEHELIYKMFNHEEAPGYGFQLKYGATTLTEQWDPRQGSSWNHFMMGQIDEWFFNSLAGIQNMPDQPVYSWGEGTLTLNEKKTTKVGYQQFKICPQPVGDLQYVKAATRTLYGTIEVYWTNKNGEFTLNVTVPVNCTAMVYMPGEKNPKEAGSGKHTFTCQLSNASKPQ